MEIRVGVAVKHEIKWVKRIQYHVSFDLAHHTNLCAENARIQINIVIWAGTDYSKIN